MTRHSKNTTDGAVFTYYERQTMKHGSIHMRIPGTALKEWDRCSLTLTQATNPVITPEGVLFEKEAILRELLRQKRESKAKKAKLKADEERLQNEMEQNKRKRKVEEEREFQKEQDAVHQSVSDSTKLGGKRERETSVSNFWLPNNTPKSDIALEESVKRRKKDITSLHSKCPIMNTPLRAKDLIPIHPKILTSNEASATSSTKIYICPLCEVTLSNNTKPIALITGSVICEKCVKRFVVEEKKDPVLDVGINIEKDVIPILNQGTGFSGSAPEELSAKEVTVYRPSVR